MWYWYVIIGVIVYLLIGLTWGRYDVVNGKKLISGGFGPGEHIGIVSFGWIFRLIIILVEAVIGGFFVYILDPLLKDTYTHIEGDVSNDILSRYKHVKVFPGIHGGNAYFRMCDEGSKHSNTGYVIKNLRKKDMVVAKLTHPKVTKLYLADLSNELRQAFNLRAL